MDASERRRLFYVAATRARDLLVVPVFGEPGKRSLLEPLAGRLPRPGEVTEEAVTEFEALTPAGESLTASAARRRRVPGVRAALAARQGWVDRRQALCAAASRPAPITSPSRLEEVESPEARADGEVRLLSRRDEALALGRAVHGLMEQVPLHDAALIPEMAVRCAAEEGVPELGGRVAELAAACWAAAPVREAAASPCVWRELPLSFVAADALVEGYADLLYRTPGGWVVVDYKTDAWPSEERVRRAYELQGGAYALAVETVSGEPVAAVRFVLAAAVQDGAARTLEVSVDDDLRQRTRRRIIEAAACDEDLTAGLR
jgi:ATP-dependent exoDNAse (exonuclease V) beta subunit